MSCGLPKLVEHEVTLFCAGQLPRHKRIAIPTPPNLAAFANTVRQAYGNLAPDKGILFRSAGSGEAWEEPL